MSKKDALINITFPDGNEKKYPLGITSLEIAQSISNNLAELSIVAEVNGNHVDLNTPINEDSKIYFYKFDDEAGKHVYWHSTSHLMAQAVEELFPGAKFGVGPAIDNGFYYDIDSEHHFTEEDLRLIEVRMKEICERNITPVREEMKREDAIEYFKTQRPDPYKVEILEDIAKDEAIVSIYHQGKFTDLCRGPHIPSTSRIKYIKLLSVSGSYWRGDENRKQLQRIYGISFPKKKMLDDYLNLLEEAKKRDHRKLGAELDLFFISPEVGGGLPIWLPKGTLVRQTLENFLKKEQVKRGYQIVATPHIGKIDMYIKSGHYPYYKDSQYPPIDFIDETGKVEQYLLKPMNCPHHFQIYNRKQHSYRDLPIRIAEFGTVYRYEQSGELNGLLRVRGFTQDDAHIFCTQEQLQDEICNVVYLTQYVSKILGFENIHTRLSFRDKNKKDKYGGTDELWDRAESDLMKASERMKLSCSVGIGEATFYGPKIDFLVKDSLGRKWQLGTVQVDYVQPENFDMTYIGSDGQKHRPVIIHRAPFGSMERFFAVLIEHFAGFFPLWLAPVQIVILTITEQVDDYAKKIYEELIQNNFRTEIDIRNEKISYKIREWENKKVPYMIILGENEKINSNISVRAHKKGDIGSFYFNEFISKINTELEQRII